MGADLLRRLNRSIQLCRTYQVRRALQAFEHVDDVEHDHDLGAELARAALDSPDLITGDDGPDHDGTFRRTRLDHALRRRWALAPTCRVRIFWNGADGRELPIPWSRAMLRGAWMRSLGPRR
jgi:hypothetical protein